MTCPHCGSALVCAACGSRVESPAADVRPELAGLVERPAGAAPTPAATDQTFLIVAKGHADLLDQLKEVVGDLGWVRLVEDRRRDESLLPREGRQGSVHVDRDLTP